MAGGFDTLRDYLDARCAVADVPGLVLMVDRGGDVVYRHLHGFRDVEQQLPVTPDTVFGVASVTKSMTALAVMQAHDRKLLSVDDPVVKWLPELEGAWNGHMHQVRVHHLLSHTVGLPGMTALFRARAASIRQDPDWELFRYLSPDPFQLDPISDYVELMAAMIEENVPPLAEPGALFNYSNESYALLQGILERATGQGYIGFVEENILTPLDMRRSVFRTEDLRPLGDVASLYAYRVEGGQRRAVSAPAWWDVGRIHANGSLKSTANDMIRYLEVFRTGGSAGGEPLLSKSSYDRMTTRHISTPVGRGYGYGVHVDTHHGVKIVTHSGSIKGVSSNFIVAPDQGITVIALANIAGCPAAALATAALNTCLGLPLETPTHEYPRLTLDVALDPYLGSYRSDEGGALDIRLADGRLVLSAYDADWPLYPYGPDGFVDETGTTPVKFLRDPAGHITGVFSDVRVLLRR